MALISEIRKRSGLVLGLIGLALVGFLVMDATTGRGAIFGGGPKTSVATVGGEEISINDFNATYQALYPQSNSENLYQNRAQVYNFMVNNTLINQETAGLGLSAGSAELSELEFGDQPHPLIGNLLGGQMTREGITQLKTAVTGNTLPVEARPIWERTHDLIKSDRIQEKLQSLIEKSVFVPTWMAEQMGKDQVEVVDLNFVRVPFDQVADKDAVVTDADLSAYLSENAGRYTQDEATRKVSFLSFDVIPSSADSAKAFQLLNSLVGEFSTTKDDSTFILSNNGSISKQYVSASTLSPGTSAAIANAGAGSVVGPFIDEKAYNLVKVLDKRSMPDSVQLRHILIAVNETRTKEAAQKLADSLMMVLNQAGGANFGDLALNFSDDQGSKNNGGEYTFPYTANLYPEFYDYAFKEGKPGSVKIVPTAQGGIHIINILAYKGAMVSTYQIASLREPIQPGKETVSMVTNAANEFLSKNRDLASLEKAAREKGMSLQSSPAVKSGDFVLGSLGQGQVPRDIVRWSFGEGVKPNMVAPQVFEMTDPRDLYPTRYILAGLKAAMPKGLSSVADVREEIEPVVRNKKKGQVLATQLKGKDLAAAAAQFNTQVDTAVGVSFASSFNPKLGNEARVVAAAFTTAMNQNSAAIIGESGVFVIRPYNKPATTPLPDAAQMRQQMTMSQRQQLANGALRSMRKAREVEDLRVTFPNL